MDSPSSVREGETGGLVSFRCDAAYDQVVGGGGSKIFGAKALSKERKEEKSRILCQIREREKEWRKGEKERKR